MKTQNREMTPEETHAFKSFMSVRARQYLDTIGINTKFWSGFAPLGENYGDREIGFIKSLREMKECLGLDATDILVMSAQMSPEQKDTAVLNLAKSRGIKIDDPDTVREKLSDLIHDQWSNWMRHMFSRSKLNDDGTVTIPKNYVDIWKWEIDTRYKDLPKEEQDSDRREADKFLKLFVTLSKGRGFEIGHVSGGGGKPMRRKVAPGVWESINPRTPKMDRFQRISANMKPQIEQMDEGEGVKKYKWLSDAHAARGLSESEFVMFKLLGEKLRIGKGELQKHETFERIRTLDDLEGIRKLRPDEEIARDMLEAETYLMKARAHKYIKRTPRPGGGWNYIYRDTAPRPLMVDREFEGPSVDEHSVSGSATVDREVVSKLDRLYEATKEAEREGGKSPDFNLCEISIPGTNLYCDENKSIPRSEMPQLKGLPVTGSTADESLPKGKDGEVDSEKLFKETLESMGVKMETKAVPAASLKAIQSELVGAKVVGMMEQLKKNPNHEKITAPIFVSSDGYILDGHHRWAAMVSLQLAQDSKKPVMMNVVQVDMKGEALVRFTNNFTERVGIAQKKASPDKPDTAGGVHEKALSILEDIKKKTGEGEEAKQAQGLVTQLNEGIMGDRKGFVRGSIKLAHGILERLIALQEVVGGIANLAMSQDLRKSQDTELSEETIRSTELLQKARKNGIRIKGADMLETDLRVQVEWQESIADELKEILRVIGNGILKKLGLMSKQEEDEPFEIKGKAYIAPGRRRPFSVKEWSSFDKAIKKYFEFHEKRLNRRLFNEGYGLGAILERMYKHGTDIHSIGYRDVKNELLKVPDTPAKMIEKYGFKTQAQGYMENSMDMVATYVTQVKDNVRNDIRHTINRAIANGEAGSIEQKLRDRFAIMNRDWRTIAVTESGNAVTQGYLHSAISNRPKGQKLFMRGAGPVDGKTSPHCRGKVAGKIVLVLDEAPEGLAEFVTTEEFGQIRQIWPGKDWSINIGTKQTNWVVVFGIQHPHCRHRWVETTAEVEEIRERIMQQAA